ncbi:MAG: response regulator [Ramlibacter sp.]
MPDNPCESTPPERSRVLVIDDDEAVIAYLLAKLGRYFEVTGITRPEDAVEAARNERPDVILCDLNMPGMQGDDVAFALSEDDVTGRIPLIYLTSLLTPSQTAELHGQFGEYPRVSKSAPAEDLLAAIRGALGLAGA